MRLNQDESFDFNQDLTGTLILEYFETEEPPYKLYVQIDLNEYLQVEPVSIYKVKVIDENSYLFGVTLVYPEKFKVSGFLNEE